MIQLYDQERGRRIGEITEAQLQILVEQLEETSGTDQDYYIDGDTLQLLEDAGADAGLLDMLRRARGSRDGYEVRWERS